MVTIRDVSQQVALETALAESEARLTVTLESVGDAVISTDVGGTVTRMNLTAEQLTGWADEGLGRPIDEVYRTISEDRRGRLSTPVRLLLRGDASTPACVRLLGRHGIERIISQKTAPVLTLEGRPIGLILTFRDITVKKETEEQIKVSDHMISLGTFAAGVAHEINNPLSALIGNLDLLTEEAAEPRGPKPNNHRRQPALLRSGSAFQNLLKEANEAAERVRLIVQDVNIYSRKPEDVSAELNIEVVVESSLRMARHEIRDRARVVKDFAPTPSVYGHEGRLGQVFVNLIANAAQSIAKGRPEYNQITISTGTEESGRVFVEIADTGVGIAPEVLPRIFDPFFTTKPVGLGTGIGLAISRRLLAALDGTLVVQSQLGKGSVFRVSLPAYRGEPVIVAPNVAIAPMVERRGRVLLIEDEPTVRAEMEQALAPTQDVISTGRARDALRLLTTGHAFDIIFCEGVMPQMTGIEFYKSLKQAESSQTDRIVFVSGKAVTGESARFIGEARNIVIRRPLHMGRLRALAARFATEGPLLPKAPRPD